MGLFDDLGKALGGLGGMNGMNGGMDGFSKLASARTRQKPGMACLNLCWVDDERCRECLAEQEPIMSGIEELRRIEYTMEHPEVLNAASFEKCGLCGAPYEHGWAECPYCGTAYPASVAIGAGLPSTPGELRALALRKAMEVQALYLPLYKKQLDRLKDGSNSFLKLTFSMNGAMTDQTMAMSELQLQQGAQKYGVALSDYLCGVMNGSMESISRTNFNNAMHEINAAQERQHQRNMQRMEQQRRSDDYRIGLWANRTASAPNYGGGGRYQRTCADCTYYSAGARKCARTGFHTNAGDSCGAFRIK